MIIDQHTNGLSQRHIGSARDKLFRAKPSNQHHQQQQSNNLLFQRHQQSIPSPDQLRSRWMELFQEQQKFHEPNHLLDG